MATARFTLPVDWNASGQITAAEDTAVLIRNTDATRPVYWAITADATPPSFAENLGHRVQPDWSAAAEHSISLKTGEVLNLTGNGETFDITVTTGAA